MNKIAIVYSLGTGNTQAMASAIEEGAKGPVRRCPFFR